MKLGKFYNFEGDKVALNAVTKQSAIFKQSKYIFNFLYIINNKYVSFDICEDKKSIKFLKDRILYNIEEIKKWDNN